MIEEEAKRWKDRCLELVKSTKNTAFLELHSLVTRVVENYKENNVDEKRVLEELQFCGRIIESFAR